MEAVQKIEQVKHLPIKFGEVARYVIVPGDPNRVPVIAESLENVINQGQNREFNAYKGTYKGIDVSVVSTGIGCPSTAIAVEELSHIGAEVFIRIGTSGSVDKSAKKGDIFIATAAVRDDGTSKQYIPIEFPAIASHNVVSNLIKASKNLNIDFPEKDEYSLEDFINILGKDSKIVLDNSLDLNNNPYEIIINPLINNINYRGLNK